MTLVEVMVSITVGLILLSGVISIFSSNKLAYRLQESTNVLDENARYALNQIQYHLRMGDHWGGIEADTVSKEATLATLAIATTVCTQSVAVSAVGFFALEGTATTPLSCIPAADYQPNTDVLIIRYAGPDRTDSADLVADNIYLRTRVDAEGMLFKGSSLGALAAASGQSLQVPTCDGAILTANARDTSMARYGEGTTFFACLMPYQSGYALNVYTTFTKASGAFSAATLGATLARTVFRRV